MNNSVFETVRQFPMNNPFEKRLFERDLVKTYPLSCPLTFQDMGIWGYAYPVFSGSWEIPKQFFNVKLKGFYQWKRLSRLYLKRKVLKTPRRPERNLAKAVLVTDEFSNGYFHWLAECLPRLLALAFLRETHTLILPEEMRRQRYVGESLKWMGNWQVEYLPLSAFWQAKELVFLDNTVGVGNYHPQTIRALHDHLSLSIGTDVPSKRLYISRERARWRKLENEEEIVSIFSLHGFERVFLEDYSLDEQRKLVASADVVAGLHGAGLTNVLFASPGTKVLELRNRGDKINNCYFSLCSELGLPYWYLECDSMQKGADTHKALLKLDPRMLSSLLEKMI